MGDDEKEGERPPLGLGLMRCLDGRGRGRGREPDKQAVWVGQGLVGLSCHAVERLLVSRCWVLA